MGTNMIACRQQDSLLSNEKEVTLGLYNYVVILHLVEKLWVRWLRTPVIHLPIIVISPALEGPKILPWPNFRGEEEDDGDLAFEITITPAL